MSIYRVKNCKKKNCYTVQLNTIIFIESYSGILIFRISKGKGNWFKKLVVRKIEGGIERNQIQGTFFVEIIMERFEKSWVQKIVL